MTSSSENAATGPIWTWTATAIATAIRNKEISSREAAQSALDRLFDVNPEINAVVEILADKALATADMLDTEIVRNGPVGSLHGVPVTTKINVDMAGHATTDGVVALKDNIATTDSPPVHNLKKAGAITIGRTNTPAFSFRWFCENDLHGRTFNPWNRSITPGGSSGGAGAAVASGIGALAHGNDIGGSVRYPGYACGVPGIRPTFGRVPFTSARGRGVCGAIMSVEGVLARSIDDLELGLTALAREDVTDPWFFPVPLQFDDAAKVGKVALFSGGSDFTAEPAVADALQSAARALSDAGYVVEEVDLPHFAEGQDLWSQLVLNEGRTLFGDAVANFGDERVRNEVNALLSITPPLDLTEFSLAMSRREQIAMAWQALLDDYVAILLPNSWELPMTLERDQGGEDVMRHILKIQSPMLLPPLLGLPGLSVPTGLANGVPNGVQIIAGRFREDRCFAIGKIIEASHPMQTPINPVAA
jgi:amidase